MLKLQKVNAVAMAVKLRLPTDNPAAFNEGTITCKVRILDKEALGDLVDKGASDSEYIDQLLLDVEGLGDENGSAITGEAAIKEVKSGPWSVFLQSAILGAYFEQFGDARVKNSRTSRGR